MLTRAKKTVTKKTKVDETVHKMRAHTPDGTKVVEWNGLPADRAAAKAEFDALMSSGMYLAYSATGLPGAADRTATMIRKFEPEAEEIVLTPRLVGGNG